MSKMNINNNLHSFLKKNKIKIFAGIAAIVTFLPLPQPKNRIRTSNSESNIGSYQSENYISNKKKHIEENIDNINVIKDYDLNQYKLIEDVYKDIPILKTNILGKQYVYRYERKNTGSIESCISCEVADYLGLTELLESKVITDKSLIKYLKG